MSRQEIVARFLELIQNDDYPYVSDQATDWDKGEPAMAGEQVTLDGHFNVWRGIEEIMRLAEQKALIGALNDLEHSDPTTQPFRGFDDVVAWLKERIEATRD